MRKRILVVEDDAEMGVLLEFNLKRHGFLVGTAADGIEGLRKARSLRPDLILLDLLLPEMDGLSVCETLQRHPVTARMPVIILTAVSSQLARLAGLEAGAADYVTKPFSFKDLIARVNKQLEAGTGRNLS